jgi:dynactin complex subunit
MQDVDADLLEDNASEELLELELQATPQTANHALATPEDSRMLQAYEEKFLELNAEVQTLRDQLHDQTQLKVRCSYGPRSMDQDCHAQFLYFYNQLLLCCLAGWI